LGKEHVYTGGEAILLAAALKPQCAVRAALVAKHLASFATCVMKEKQRIEVLVMALLVRNTLNKGESVSSKTRKNQY
jgi:ABC-type uncharacterized transport system permease subunit